MDKSIIFESVIKQAETVMIPKISTVTVANECGVSEANIYKVFKTKDNLLRETFDYIDKMLAEKMNNEIHITEFHNVEDMIIFTKENWFGFIKFFLAHKNYYIYYAAYRGISIFKRETISKYHSKNHHEMLEQFKKLKSVNDGFHKYGYEKYWLYIIDVSLMFVNKINDGTIPENDEILNGFFDVIFDGLFIKLGWLKTNE